VTSEYVVANDLGGYQAERNAIAAISEGKMTVGIGGHLADVWESILSLRKCSRPGHFHLDFADRVNAIECPQQLPRFGRDQSIPFCGILKWLVPTPDDNPALARCSGVKVRIPCFPDE
jgi:hypothetical protein